MRVRNSASWIDIKLSTKVAELDDVMANAERPVVEMDRTTAAGYITAEEITQMRSRKFHNWSSGTLVHRLLPEQ